ncbi:MAG: translation initiation factor IF-2, partial [Veillonella sp.]|nr:translation initiation factor IF-2 [Veillonella sp.]
MSKKRVHEIAKEFGVESKQVISILQQHNFNVTKAVNTVDDAGYTVVKNQLGGKSNGADTKAAAAPANPSKHEKAATPNKAVKTDKPAKEQSHKKEAKHDDKKHDDKKSNVRHVQINEPTKKQNNGQKQDGRNHQKQDRPNGNQQGQKNDGQQGQKNDNRHNGNADNRNRNGRVDNRNNNGGNQQNGNDRRNKKNKKGNNRPQSLLSTSMQKKKNKVKHRNEQYLQHKAEEERKAQEAIATEIELSGPLTVKELAEKMGREVSEIIKKLMLLGVMASINQEVDVDTATIVAEDFGVTVIEVEPEEDPTDIIEIEDAPETLKPRPPVVTIMGHVDHGKTSLLDVIRQTNVTAGEAGGITQHIGAYQVRYNDNKITFLDTPGHEAFTAMRLRGAKSTDIAVLVVAADDGVMPQTIEAINHAKSADVPIIVAINKMDKPGANPDHVKQQLSEHGLLPEEWGGDVIMVPVSAKQKQGIDDLLENILLVAEVMELKANPNRKAYGVVIEAQLDKGRGAVCTVLVQKGSLRVGDTVLAGTAYGKVRAMTNERGEKVKVARPSMPVEILGFSEVPQAGEIIYGMDDNEARTIA